MTKNLALFLLAALLLAACGQSTTAPTPTPAAPPEATVAPTAAAAAPTQEPTAMPEPSTAPPSEEPPGTEVETFQQLYNQAMTTIVAAKAQCPTRTYPIPDPPVSVKRPLDFSPFSAALLSFSPEQADAIDAALDGKTIPQIQTLLADGTLTSEQLVLSYLARIQRYDEGRLNAVMELNPEALTIARDLDAERAAGAVRGPLHGIPVMLKDNIATAGPLHTTAGNYALKDWQPDRDAFLVTQLREAGAVILGKNNLSEWANYTDVCMPSGFSTLGGQGRNPHGPYDTLGSSSGSAVAVAAELTTVSVGSETAGSLVQPSRANGVVGMRPSKGLVSGDYIIPLEPTLDTAGPIGRSVTDVAVLLSALAATDPNDPNTAAAAELADVDFTQYLSLDEARKLRVGVVIFDATANQYLGVSDFAALKPEEQQGAMAQLQPVLQSATQPIIDALKGQGIEVVTIKESELPRSFQGPYVAYIPYGFREGISRFFAGVGAGAPVRSLEEVVRTVNEDKAARAPYGQGYVEGAVATTITAEQYQAAVNGDWQVAEAWLSDVAKEYNVDVILFGSNYANLGAAGVPALNIPIGRLEGSNEPTGVYLTGPHFSDARLIAVGYALEQALGVRLVPDLDATIKEIDAVTGR
ncbi:MAG: amidase [Chloroflexales bacterium]|nr:amidase [Chloroflexales bacterium]